MIGKDIGYRTLPPEASRTLGCLLSHITHDFGNLLTPLLSYPDLVRVRLPEQAPERAMLDAMERAARDMAHIVGQLQLLAWQEELDAETMDVNLIVSEIVGDLKYQPMAESVTFTVELTDAATTVCVSADGLIAAVANVCRNAAEAAAPAGRVCVRTARADLPAGVDVTGAPSPAGPFISVEVTDSGPGLAPHVRDALCEPFVTTRNAAAQRGAGLGLTIVFNALRRQGGRLEVSAPPEGGARFVLWVPAAPAV